MRLQFLSLSLAIIQLQKKHFYDIYPRRNNTSKYQKDQIADHDVAYFVIYGSIGKTFTIDVLPKYGFL